MEQQDGAGAVGGDLARFIGWVVEAGWWGREVDACLARWSVARCMEFGVVCGDPTRPTFLKSLSL